MYITYVKTVYSFCVLISFCLLYVEMKHASCIDASISSSIYSPKTIHLAMYPAHCPLHWHRLRCLGVRTVDIDIVFEVCALGLWISRRLQQTSPSMRTHAMITDLHTQVPFRGETTHVWCTTYQIPASKVSQSDVQGKNQRFGLLQIIESCVPKTEN